MHTTIFPFALPIRAARIAALSFALLAARGLAQQPAIPDAPTVPEAPTLPDNAVIKEPLQPAASQEIIDERPSMHHVWVPGHWRWQDGRYAWIAGRWEIPPRANVTWVEPRWEKRGNGVVLAGGYWQEAVAQVAVPSSPAPAAVQEVVVVTAPPPPRREAVPARPMPGYVWVNGYWAWHDNRYFWIGGHYERPPHERAVWVAPRWERRGGGYVFIEGTWH